MFIYTSVCSLTCARPLFLLSPIIPELFFCFYTTRMTMNPMMHCRYHLDGNEDPHNKAYKLKDGVIYEDKQTDQKRFDDAGTTVQCSGDGTVPYASLRYPETWRNSLGTKNAYTYMWSNDGSLVLVYAIHCFVFLCTPSSCLVSCDLSIMFPLSLCIQYLERFSSSHLPSFPMQVHLTLLRN